MQIFVKAQGCYSFYSWHVSSEIWNDGDKLELFDFSRKETMKEARKWGGKTRVGVKLKDSNLEIKIKFIPHLPLCHFIYILLECECKDDSGFFVMKNFFRFKVKYVSSFFIFFLSLFEFVELVRVEISVKDEKTSGWDVLFLGEKAKKPQNLWKHILLSV